MFLVSRQAYYQWLRKQRELTLRDQQEISLCKSITTIYTQHRMVYGSRKVHCTLREHGVRVGRNRVARIMQEQGLFGIRKPRKFKNASHSTPSEMLKNVLNRQFYPTKPNTVWLTDFTQMRVKGGSDLFLAVVLDMFSRSVVGWAVHPTRTGVALHAIQAAVALRMPKPGVLLHSDRGSECTSLEMQLDMQKCGIKQSFSRIGNCWDNAPIESFFRHCKAELRSMQHVPFDLARTRVADYIENFYNRERVHSAINYRTPIQCENDWQLT